jgi:CRP-like cAMP-binding protein
MRTIKELISEHPFFKGLDEQYLDVIAACAHNVRFLAGEYVIREGGEANEFYLIRHGKISLEAFLPGQGAITIQTIQEGDVLGWSWLFAPYRWHFDARAVELTRAIAFDGRCLREKSEEDKALGYELMKRFSYIMVQRLQATRLQLLDVYGVKA